MNEVEPDMMNLVPIMEFVMTLPLAKLDEHAPDQPLREYLALNNPKVLEYREKDFQTYVGFHRLEGVQAMFNQVTTVERTRRKAKQDYERKQRMERLKIWKKK